MLYSLYTRLVAALSSFLSTCVWLIRHLRFPFLWFDVVWRTIVFGLVTYLPVCKIRFQFWDLCSKGVAWEGLPFSSRHSGALVDVIHPPELADAIADAKNKGVALDKEKQKKFPAMLLFSGGAWIIGKRLWMRPMAMHFADAGFVAVPIDYRQWPFGTIPDMVDDALDSFVWVFDQIGKEGSPLEHVDPDQVFVLGQSAGAHICSLALLELAKLRREQMMLAQSGATACDRPFFHTMNKGVPIAFIGLSGMFDLVTTQKELHKKGLHRRVLQSLVGHRPVVDFCARSKSLQIAEEVRSTLPTEDNDGSHNNSNSSSSGSPSDEQISQQHKRNNSHSGEICDHDTDTRSRRNGGAAAAADATAAAAAVGHHHHHHQQPAAQRSAVHFLPRFNLFMHGDEDTSAPLQQALNTCAAYNDAASRHTDELVGDDVEWTRHDETVKTAKDGFYILTAKANKASPFAGNKLTRSKLTKNNNGSAAAAASSHTRNISASSFASATPSFSSVGDDLYCDCFEGNRSMFMSYLKGTHTSLIVQDFFRKDVTAPVVVAALALQKSLRELAEKHRQAEAMTPDQLSRESSSTASFHARSNSGSVFCGHHGPQLLQSSASSMSSLLPGSRTPARVAPASYAMVDLFTKNYLEVDKAAVRNSTRPVIWDTPMNIANKISAF